MFNFTGPIIGAILLIAGILGVMKIKGISDSVRGLFGIIPLGNPKLWSVVAIAGGLALGGATTISQFVKGKISSASILPSEKEAIVQGSISCIFANAPAEVTSTSNVTFRADQNDLSHYYADWKYDSHTTGVIDGALFCTSNRPNIRDGVTYDCHVEADKWKSETSTSDSNTYLSVATKTSASKISGYTWAQNISLADEGTTNQGAGDSDPDEQVQLTFAQDEVTQYLGYEMMPVGGSVSNQWNNQTSHDVKFYCNGQRVATLTLTKTAS